MEAGTMEYLGETELLQYSVKEWRMEKAGSNLVKAVFKVHFHTFTLGRVQGAEDLREPPLHHLHPRLLPPPHLLLHPLLQEGTLQDKPPRGHHYLVR